MPIQLPHLLKSLTARLHSRFAKGRVENDLSEELQFHLQNEIEKSIEDGAISVTCESCGAGYVFDPRQFTDAAGGDSDDPAGS